MFATLFAQEARTLGGRNAAGAGLAALVCLGSLALTLLDIPRVTSLLFVMAIAAIIVMPMIALIQIAVEYWQSMYGGRGYFTMSLPVRGRTVFAAKVLYALAAALVTILASALLLLVWAAAMARTMGVSLSELLEPLRLMVGMASTEGVVFMGASTLISMVVFVVQCASVMSIGAQGRWNHLGFGAPMIGFVILYLVNQVVALASMLFFPLSIDLINGGFTTRTMLPAMIEAMRTNSDPAVLGVGTVVTAPILTAFLTWWAVRAIERHTCLR